MGPAGELHVVEDVPDAFCRLVARSAPRRLALSGGDLARRCYERLAGADLDWSAVTVLFGDERFVPPDHPDSNEGMARRALLDAVAPAEVRPMYRPGPIAAAARAYDAELRALGPLDVVHLGMGADGHTASLFPGNPALDEHERLVVATGDAAHAWPRLTLTFAGIARARLVVVTVAGADKRAALARVRAGDELPAARVRAEHVVWLVDAAAAGGRSSVVCGPC